MHDEPVLTCPICSKRICAGMGTARVGNVVAHLRCLARQNGLRALELQDRASRLQARAERAKAQTKALLAERRSFVLAGRITAFDRAARLVTVGVLDVILAETVPLDGLALGLSVTVTGNRDGDERIATTLEIRSSVLW